MIAATSVAQDRREKTRYVELDGLRGVAILLVLAFHFGASADYGILADVIGFGWAGVELFFVLSGFLITGILLEAKGSSNYFSRFYLRRIFRIFPIYYAFLILFFHVAPWVNRHTGLLSSVQYGRSDELSYWLYLANWKAAFEQNRYLRHFWSLAIEEQFYLLWPLLIYVLPRRAVQWFCLALLIACPLARWEAMNLGVSRYFLYRLTPFRLEGLSCGALLALSLGDPILRSALKRIVTPLSVVAVAVLALVIARGGTSYLNPNMAVAGYTAIAIACASAVFPVLEVARKGALWPRMLRSRRLVSFGRYSYGAYVWHLPIAEQYRLFLEHHPGLIPRFVLLPFSIITGCLLSWTVAWLSWRLIEGPCARWKERLAR